MGRDHELIVPWRSLRLNGLLPIVAFWMEGFGQIGESGDARDGEIRLSVFAQGDDAQNAIDAIMERLEQIYTWNAFHDHGCDAAPMLLHTDDGPEDEDRDGTRGLERGDLRMSITHTVTT